MLCQIIPPFADSYRTFIFFRDTLKVSGFLNVLILYTRSLNCYELFLPMRRLTKSRTEGDAVRACSPPQGSPQGRVPDFVKRMLDDVLFDTQLRWVEKSGQAPHWTTFVLDAGALTFTGRAADKTPPKVECRPTVIGFLLCWYSVVRQLAN